MRTARTLTGIFSGAVGVALAASACGGKTIDVSNLQAPPNCTPQGHKLLVGLQPTNPADYLEDRTEYPYDGPVVEDAGADGGDGGVPMPSGRITVREFVGTKCGGAKDVAACTAALEALRLPNCTSVGSAGGGNFGADIPHCDYFAFTRGDMVGTLATVDELRAYLGTIDNAAEAILLASRQYGTPRCDGKEQTGWRAVPGGYELVIVTGDGECFDKVRKLVKVTADGQVIVLAEELLDPKSSTCAIGRRPAGLVEMDASCTDPVGAFFARAAFLEAASVDAFRVLAGELRAHGAPRGLVARATRAANDEIAHARMTAAIARRHGGRFERPRVLPRPVRSLEEIAIENATEGCVNETYGALVATFQARAAGDRRIRAAMQRIARDETRHAALARDVAAWAESRLSPEARARASAARRRAVLELRLALEREPDAALAEVAGMPNAAQARALFAAAAPRLWAA